MTYAVSLEGISKSFGKIPVLNDIDLKIREGTIYGFIGPSGAGKTTLVKMLVGMEVPTRGSVFVFNQKMPNLNVLQNIGYMAQSDALYLVLTGMENLEFFASLYKLKKNEKKERIAYAADLVNLSNDLTKKVSNYSGGMKRRLSLAIALIQNPNLLILDEPTVGIDPELRLTIWEELFRLKKEGKTIIVTTHVMEEAEKCDKIAMVREGRILTEGAPKQLKERYHVDSFDEVFLHAGRERQ